ncbi:hypothetical protein CEXT_726421 [Caerostris extrusa]|uniref:Uncharacterized protein n=1 Tax=Caerostris extrusa TaxID=172846 RepID=A0AAV4XLI8_CAEEX|nr:hypothetical protein CEXT_726421 [Caerostris extrusa]
MEKTGGLREPTQRNAQLPLLISSHHFRRLPLSLLFPTLVSRYANDSEKAAEKRRVQDKYEMSLLPKTYHCDLMESPQLSSYPHQSSLYYAEARIIGSTRRSRGERIARGIHLSSFHLLALESEREEFGGRGGLIISTSPNQQNPALKLQSKVITSLLRVEGKSTPPAVSL